MCIFSYGSHVLSGGGDVRPQDEAPLVSYYMDLGSDVEIFPDSAASQLELVAGQNEL
jgi:hypothetical protein